MKTIQQINRTQLRHRKKILASVLFLSVLMTQYKSHNVSHTPVDDLYNSSARIEHVREILKEKLQSSQKTIDMEQSLSRDQIEAYISMKNSGLDSRKLAQTIIEVSQKHNYDPVFILAVIKTESRFNPNAIGSVGERGLMQIKPSTAEWIAKKLKFPWKGKEALFDPSYNIQIGALYMKYLKKTALTPAAEYINAYNLGPKNLRRLPSEARKEHPYFDKVVENYIDIYRSFEKTNS